MNNETAFEFLTIQDIEKIRKLLPYGWRQQIQQRHPRLTTRQISETFYLRTSNPLTTGKVFTAIAKYLDRMGEHSLSIKCRDRIRYCKKRKLAAAA
jgi:hypothetical protein